MGDCDGFQFHTELLGIANVQRALVAVEPHADGGRHIHAIIQCGPAIHTRNERHFDILGHHPNIGAVRRLEAANLYLRKGWTDDDGTKHEPELYGEIEVVPAKRKRDDIYREALASSNSDEFLRIIANGCARDRVIFSKQIEEFANKLFKQEVEPYKPDAEHTFELPEPIEEWVATEFNKVPDPSWVWRHPYTLLLEPLG